MTGQTGLTAEAGASVATANYIGYFAGAVTGTLAPGLMRSHGGIVRLFSVWGGRVVFTRDVVLR
jgi:hypothetical protein